MKSVRAFFVGFLSSILSQVFLPAWFKAEFLHIHNWNFLIAQVPRPKKNHNKNQPQQETRQQENASTLIIHDSYLISQLSLLKRGFPESWLTAWLKPLASVSFCQLCSGCLIWVLPLSVFNSCHQVYQKQPAIENKAPWFRKKWVMETFNGVKQI